MRWPPAADIDEGPMSTPHAPPPLPLPHSPSTPHSPPPPPAHTCLLPMSMKAPNDTMFRTVPENFAPTYDRKKPSSSTNHRHCKQKKSLSSKEVHF